MNICWIQLKLNELNDWDNVQKITDLYQWKLQPLIQVLCKWQPNSQHLQNYYKDQPCLTMLVQTCCKTIPVLKIDWKLSMKIKSSLWYFGYTLTGKIFHRNDVIYQTNKWQVDQHGHKNLMCLWILRNIWNTHIQCLIIDIFRTVYIDNVVKLRTKERLVAYFFIHCKNFLFEIVTWI